MNSAANTPDLPRPAFASDGYLVDIDFSRFDEATKMQMLGALAFGAITVVNLIVLGLVLAGLFRRVRAHH